MAALICWYSGHSVSCTKGFGAFTITVVRRCPR